VTRLRVIELERAGAVATLWMNRPERHNAFDEQLIAELTAAAVELDADPAVRVIVLAGRGASFSAGGDLHWMKRQAEARLDDNVEDARALARMLRTLYRCRKPTVARIHGAALGGGMGLVAVCDIALASASATFGTTEARLGLIPATIGPYVQAAIGARAAQRYFQTGERFGAGQALRLGLVHELAMPDALDARLGELLEDLLACGPQAQARSKALSRYLVDRPVDGDEVFEETARRIAEARAADEGRDGVAAFLGKRAPSWRA
jgi:methylglutaconyl-CoA hydratase